MTRIDVDKLVGEQRRIYEYFALAFNGLMRMPDMIDKADSVNMDSYKRLIKKYLKESYKRANRILNEFKTE